MYEDFAPRLAKVITEYSAPIRKGDFVVISGSIAAAPLIEALYQAVLQRGGYPLTMVYLPGLTELRLRIANNEQLAFEDPLAKLIVEKADVILDIEAPINTKALSDTDPAKLAIIQKANSPRLETHLARIADGSLRWCYMPWPTDAAAQQSELGIHAYREFVYRACGLDREDPVAYWQGFKERQLRLVEYLKDKNEARIEGPGIELSFRFQDRVWVSAHGDLNFPDGEIFTGPVEDSVEGSVAFNLRSVLYGRETAGVKLRFESGRVVEASAEKGQDFLLTQLDLDEGARRLGEVAIGTNWGVDRITGSTLFDEKIGGSLHMALGRSIPETLGVNQSQMHWDMVHDMRAGGKIWIDGVLFYDSGRFLIE
ncbi:MAG TPA: aminopeptidase [Anaerolineales bacterium]|nr:aminopeptidase [Anaerolineales bacterium]